MVKVRIAPSPTGYLHLGTARSALYNWLFARHNKGKFILRIEDTDPERSRKEMVDVILEALKWLGLDWDEDIVYQSDRFDIYREYAKKLLEEGSVYRCFCSEERLEQERKKALEKGYYWKYDRKCLNLSQQEIEDKLRKGTPYVLRFKVPNNEIVFHDLLHGEIKKMPKDIEDFIIMRKDNTPTYNFACVVDDHLMGITHVIRGVEHIANTPKQVLLYHALGWEPPQFIHLPLILGKDRKKLSKRHGVVSLLWYRDEGYLKEALVNYLALLGWSPGGNREIVSIEEMIELFDITKVNKSNAIFDQDKLDWMNSQYIRMFTPEKLYERLVELYKEEVEKYEKEKVIKIIKIHQERVKKLKDFLDAFKIYFDDNVEYHEKAIKKYLSKSEFIERLKELLEEFKKIKDFNKEETERALRGLSERKGIKAAHYIHPLRAAVTGNVVGPPLFDIFEVLDKEQVLFRIEKAIKEFTGGSSNRQDG